MEVPSRVGRSIGGFMLKERENLEWRSITGYEDQYEVSNYGDFHILPYEFIDKANRHITRKERYIWSEDLSYYGGNENKKYLGIHLGGMKKSYAHRLAAIEFVPNPYNKPEVNHIDGKTNNNYCGCEKNNYKDSNLEWVTSIENMAHASKNNLINKESVLRKQQCKKNREKVNYDAFKKPVVQINPTDGSYINEFESVSEASRQLNIGNTAIQSVAKHDKYHKTAGGFVWIYKEEYDASADNRVKRTKYCKKVAKLNDNGEIISVYESIKQAAIENNYPIENYIGDVCNGRKEKYKGFKWKFI